MTVQRSISPITPMGQIDILRLMAAMSNRYENRRRRDNVLSMTQDAIQAVNRPAFGGFAPGSFKRSRKKGPSEREQNLEKIRDERRQQNRNKRILDDAERRTNKVTRGVEKIRSEVDDIKMRDQQKAEAKAAAEEKENRIRIAERYPPALQGPPAPAATGPNPLELDPMMGPYSPFPTTEVPSTSVDAYSMGPPNPFPQGTPLTSINQLGQVVQVPARVPRGLYDSVPMQQDYDFPQRPRRVPELIFEQGYNMIPQDYDFLR